MEEMLEIMNSQGGDGDHGLAALARIMVALHPNIRIKACILDSLDIGVIADMIKDTTAQDATLVDLKMSLVRREPSPSKRMGLLGGIVAECGLAADDAARELINMPLNEDVLDEKFWSALPSSLLEARVQHGSNAVLTKALCTAYQREGCEEKAFDAAVEAHAVDVVEKLGAHPDVPVEKVITAAATFPETTALLHLALRRMLQMSKDLQRESETSARVLGRLARMNQKGPPSVGDTIMVGFSSSTSKKDKLEFYEGNVESVEEGDVVSVYFNMEGKSEKRKLERIDAFIASED